METGNTQTATRQTDFRSFASDERDGGLAQKRLDALLVVNAKTAREKLLFASEQTKMEAAMMKNPLSGEQAFARFGLLLGIFPPAAFFIRFLFFGGVLDDKNFWILGVVAVVNLITATVGYFSGKFVGKIVGELELLSWSKMLLALPFVGLLWGGLSGGLGGVVIFIFGAVFGAMLGAAIGIVALPAFTTLHRLLKKGDAIDRRHFLPLAFGVTFVISAFILGYKF